MQNGIEIELNNEKGLISLNAVNTRIYCKQQDILILHKTLKSVFVKDVQNQNPDAFLYFLKIVTNRNEKYVISFKTDHIREVFKIFMLNVIKAQQNSGGNEENVYLNMLAEMHELPKIENTKTSLVEYLVSNSVLILIFYEMNCTLSQFYNYIKQSYFYDIKNTKNVIDRMLNEKLRNFTISKDTYATRLNNFSFLSINDRKENTIGEKVYEEKKYKFVPIYTHNKVKIIKERKDFVIPQKIKLFYEYNPKKEEVRIRKDFDKKILQKLLELCKNAYLIDLKDTIAKENILQEIEKYKEILNDDYLSAFNPVNYLGKKNV